MNSLSATMTKLQELHRTGHLAEAKQGYLAILDENPNNVAALHLLAVIYAEEGDLEAAQRHLERACSLQPDEPVLFLHLANILKAKGALAEACQVLLDLTDAHPSFAAGYNNLGTLYFAQGKWLPAITAYQNAIDIQADYIDAYYNLGLACHKANRILEAKHAYEAVLELAPEHSGARFQLACFFMQQENDAAALEQFSLLEKKHPFHFETQSNLASCYLRTGRLDAAHAHYLKALEIMPEDSQILFNLGVINMQQGRVHAAIEYYLRALKINPDFYEAHNNVGVAYLAQKNADAALLHFREAFRLRPDDAVVQHTINILMRKQNLSTAPLEYVRSLFDSYAGHYDVHLKKSLHYQVPQLLHTAVGKVLGATSNYGDVLDMGCGTGLCAEIFKPQARTLIGIDVSSKMLAVAKQKKLYNQLIQSELEPYLATQHAAFDLIIAGDVLVYCGDLTSIFTAVSQALRPNGLFAFNTEISTIQDYEMTESGRFAQSKAYIDKLAAQHHLTVQQYQTATLRTQEDVAVPGYLYVLQKKA